MKIYHNPKCSKSRTAKKALDEANINYETRLYLDNPLTVEELKSLLAKLDLQIADIIRTKETIWKESFKGKEYSDDELLKIVTENIKLLERPIVEHKDNAVVARSDEALAKIIGLYSA